MRALSGIQAAAVDYAELTGVEQRFQSGCRRMKAEKGVQRQGLRLGYCQRWPEVVIGRLTQRSAQGQPVRTTAQEQHNKTFAGCAAVGHRPDPAGCRGGGTGDGHPLEKFASFHRHGSSLCFPYRHWASGPASIQVASAAARCGTGSRRA